MAWLRWLLIALVLQFGVNTEGNQPKDLSRTFPLTSNVENGSYSNTIIFNIHQNRKGLRIFITNEHLCLTLTVLLGENFAFHRIQNNLILCTRELSDWNLEYADKCCLFAFLWAQILLCRPSNPYWCLRCIICFKNDHNTVLNCIEQCREVTSSSISKS